MKKLASIIALIAIGLSAFAQTNSGSIFTDIGSTLGDFITNNPTNKWDVSAYVLNNTTKGYANIADGWGGGARLGYWLNPSVGVAVDASYTDQSWTFANLGLTARATIKFSDKANLATYAIAGPGWNIDTASGQPVKSIVAVAGAGASLHWDKLPVDVFGEYRHITTKQAQDQVLLGFTKHF